MLSFRNWFMFFKLEFIKCCLSRCLQYRYWRQRIQHSIALRYKLVNSNLQNSNYVIKSINTFSKATWTGAGSRLFSRSLQLVGMCKDKQRGNYERGCFDIMSISLNRLLRFDAKVRVCVKKLRKKQYASWILLYFGHAARGHGKKNIIFEFLCFDLDLVLVPLRKQKMEKLKAVKKRAPKWSEAEINALVNAVESQRRQILGYFSSDITSSTKTHKLNWSLISSA